MELNGAVAVVTGGGGAIGSRIAEQLTARGARVARWDVHPADGVTSCDVTDEESVAAAFEQTVRTVGEPTVLVNCHGVSGGRATWVSEVEGDDWSSVLSPRSAWDAVFAVNVVGVVNTSRAFAKVVARHKKPSAIVNITSTSGEQVTDPALTAYSASKAAANMITRIAALDFASLGIRVNAVAPGLMDNRMRSSGVTTQTTAPTVADPDAFLKRVLAATPLEHRPVTALDIADTVLSLLGTDFVTGQIVAVDGGLTLQDLSKG